MRAMPAVAVHPEQPLAGAFGLAVGPGCVGLSEDVLQPEFLASLGEDFGAIARTVVGQDALDGDPEALAVGDGGLEEGDG
jgi:hypothetical protein